MIRPYQVSDREILLEILNRNTPKYFDPTEVPEFAAYINQHGDSYFTAVADDKIVGGAGYRLDSTGTTGFIRWIFFDPDQAGKGLGREIVALCAAKLQEMGATKLVAATSQLAAGFFERQGMTLVRTEQNYWGPGLDLYLMERQLG